MSDGGRIVIDLVRAGRVIRTWRLPDDKVLTIGSAEGCSIRTKGASLQPEHASIFVEEGELTLVPSGDEAEIKLNGEVVDFAVPEPDDLIKCGRMTLKARWEPPTDQYPVLPPEEPPTDRVPEPEVPTEAPYEEPETEVTPRPTAPLADTAGEPLWFDDDDDDDDELTWVEPFDLAEELLRPPEPEPGVKRALLCTGLVVRVVEGRVVETISVLPGQPYQAPNGELSCRLSAGRLHLVTSEGMAGQLWQNKDGEQVESELGDTALSGGLRRVSLARGEGALLLGSKGMYRLKAFAPPKGPLHLSLGIIPLFLVSAALALGAHAALGMVLVVLSPPPAEEVVGPEKEVFAMLEMAELDKPKPPPTAAKMAEKAPTITSQNVQEARERPKETTVNTLLQKLTQGGEAGGAGSSLGQLTASIEGVPSADGPAAFNLGGAIEGLTGAPVTTSREAGSGNVNTRGGGQVARSAGRLADGTKGEGVRGRVQEVKSQVKVEGRLSREAVSRVVNSHIHEVQGCYERELVADPTLRGKLVFEWTVTEIGGVQGVRVQQSSMQGTKVADCIAGNIRKWTFPAPDGGSVTISYPFMFRSQ